MQRTPTESITDYFRRAERETEYLCHRDKTNDAYHSCTDLIREVINETNKGLKELNWNMNERSELINAFELTKNVLEKYRVNGSDKSKKSVIGEFAGNLKLDLHRAKVWFGLATGEIKG